MGCKDFRVKKLESISLLNDYNTFDLKTWSQNFIVAIPGGKNSANCLKILIK